MFFVYVLFYESRNRYYIGSTGDSLDELLRKHNSNHKGFTGRLGDWVLQYSENYSSLTEARKRELQIKKWKSKAMIGKLILKQGNR